MNIELIYNKNLKKLDDIEKLKRKEKSNILWSIALVALAGVSVWKAIDCNRERKELIAANNLLDELIKESIQEEE